MEPPVIIAQHQMTMVQMVEAWWAQIVTWQHQVLRKQWAVHKALADLATNGAVGTLQRQVPQVLEAQEPLEPVVAAVVVDISEAVVDLGLPVAEVLRIRMQLKLPQ